MAKQVQRQVQRVCGTRVLRREDASLLRGSGCFVNDLTPPHALHLVFVRSNVAAGKIVSIGLSAAFEQPGIKAIFTGRDVTGLGSLPINPVIAPTRLPGYPLLAHERIDAVGQALVVIVATSINEGLDAAELVEIDIDEQNLELGDKLQDRCVFAEHWSDSDYESVIASGSISVSVTIEHPRLAPSPLETRSIAVIPNAADGSLRVFLSFQTPHRARQHLAEILGINKQLLHIIAPDVGGAFGMKASLYPEEVLAVWIADKLKVAIRWQATRSEDMLSATHGRGARSEGTLVLNEEGKFLGLRASISCPLGHWLPNSAAIPAWNAGRILPGPYRVDAVYIDTKASLSNTAPVGIYRGAGRPEAAMLMERLIEKAARQMNLDPVTLRQQNFISAEALPHTHTTGVRLDAGDYGHCLDKLCELAQLDVLRDTVKQRRVNGEIVGIGIACFVEPCGSGWESASLKRFADGQLIASIGGSSQGHGRETAYAQLLADEFDVPLSSIKIHHGDTEVCPSGIGALASRSTAIGGSALLAAALDIKKQMQSSADLLPVYESNVVYHAEHEAWGAGFYLALVAIEADTGHLNVERLYCTDEIGRIINPLLTEGQLLGGIAQGLGEALMEQLIYDENGQLITGSFSDYALPRAMDMPSVEIQGVSLPAAPTDANILGAKGVGEAGTIGVPAAIVNAAIDAVSEFGITDLQMPLTSEQLWRAISVANDAC